MTVMFLLIGFSITVAFFFLLAFIWAIRSGQFDDTTTPAMRILFPEEEDEENKEVKKKVDINKILDRKK